MTDSTATTADKRFAGQTALITGASDHGIGGAVAERLAREGAAIAVLGLHLPKRLFRKAHKMGANVHFEECDITDAQQVRTAVAAVGQHFGKVDVLVNNAGIEIARPLDQFPEDDWERLLDVNLRGAVRVTQATVPLMKSGGAIINIASALGTGGCAGFSVYSASKAGMIGFTQSLAVELAPRRIRTIALAPALVATPMTLKHLSTLSSDQRDDIDRTHPVGTGMPHDVAAAAAFFASKEAGWITGVTLPMGWLPQYPIPVAQFMGTKPAEDQLPPTPESSSQNQQDGGRKVA